MTDPPHNIHDDKKCVESFDLHASLRNGLLKYAYKLNIMDFGKCVDATSLSKMKVWINMTCESGKYGYGYPNGIVQSAQSAWFINATHSTSIPCALTIEAWNNLIKDFHDETNNNENNDNKHHPILRVIVVLCISRIVNGFNQIKITFIICLISIKSNSRYDMDMEILYLLHNPRLNLNNGGTPIR